MATRKPKIVFRYDGDAVGDKFSDLFGVFDDPEFQKYLDKNLREEAKSWMQEFEKSFNELTYEKGSNIFVIFANTSREAWKADNLKSGDAVVDFGSAKEIVEWVAPSMGKPHESLYVYETDDGYYIRYQNSNVTQEYWFDVLCSDFYRVVIGEDIRRNLNRVVEDVFSVMQEGKAAIKKLTSLNAIDFVEKVFGVEIPYENELSPEVVEEFLFDRDTWSHLYLYLGDSYVDYVEKGIITEAQVKEDIRDLLEVLFTSILL